MKNCNISELVWHYTTGEKFKLIVESGLLLTASIGVYPPEKPILWFSSHPYFEPTAIKNYELNGKIRRLSLPELFKLGRGLCRFGYQKKLLLSGQALRADARMPLKIWKRLEQVALEQGSHSRYWWGITECLPIGNLVIEVMADSMNWERVQ